MLLIILIFPLLFILIRKIILLKTNRHLFLNTILILPTAMLILIIILLFIFTINISVITVSKKIIQSFLWNQKTFFYKNSQFIYFHLLFQC